MACARHGCFVPTSIVDFFKGEQQKNMDFAFLQAINFIGLDPDQGAMLIYDIACQYMVHFLERIGSRLPEGLTVESAIGLFHVHAHKDSCFFRFATSFIPGAGNVAGEILESLWSNLNAISPSARTATLAYRSELLDDHACDSNHKKAVGMRAALCTRAIDAEKTLQDAEQYYNTLSEASGSQAIAAWEAAIQAAERKRKDDLSVMDIYAAKGTAQPVNQSASSAASRRPPIDTWMDFALTVEEFQYVTASLLPCTLTNNIRYRLEIQLRVKAMGRYEREIDRKAVDTKREALSVMLQRLAVLQFKAGVLPSTDSTGAIPDDPPDIPDYDDEEPAAAPAQGSDDDENQVPIENQLISLPSNANVRGDLRSIELKHRITQAKVHLNRLRDLVADMSFQYSHVMRAAPNKGVRTRSRTAIAKMRLEVRLAAKKYRRCRARIASLGADADTLNTFRLLLDEDLKASTAMLKPNMPGSTQLKLSWLWYTSTGHLPAAGHDQYLDTATEVDSSTLLECEFGFHDRYSCAVLM